jgi:hypothetical protein
MYEITICDVIETRYPHLSYFAVDVINIVSADTQFKKKVAISVNMLVVGKIPKRNLCGGRRFSRLGSRLGEQRDPSVRQKCPVHAGT